MLGHPQRLEAELLCCRRELVHRDRVVGREDRNAELHPFMVKDSEMRLESQGHPAQTIGAGDVMVECAE